MAINPVGQGLEQLAVVPAVGVHQRPATGRYGVDGAPGGAGKATLRLGVEVVLVRAIAFCSCLHELLRDHALQRRKVVEDDFKRPL
jgi:hypothetical protein